MRTPQGIRAESVLPDPTRPDPARESTFVGKETQVEPPSKTAAQAKANVSYARELAAMRSRMWPALTPAEVRSINWAAVADAAAEAFAKGWTGFEVGSAAVENLGNARNVGAIIVANIRGMGRPVRETTPTPPPARVVLDLAGHRPARNPTAHANRIREARP